MHPRSGRKVLKIGVGMLDVGERGWLTYQVTEVWWGHSGLGNDSEDTEIAGCLDMLSIVCVSLRLFFTSDLDASQPGLGERRKADWVINPICGIS